MANIVTITSNTNAIAPAIFVETNSDKYTFVGYFTYYAIGKTLYITGSASILKFDLLSDSATVNGTTGLSAVSVVTELNKQFIK